jgi:hypothetical protein
MSDASAAPNSSPGFNPWLIYQRFPMLSGDVPATRWINAWGVAGPGAWAWVQS